MFFCVFCSVARDIVVAQPKLEIVEGKKFYLDTLSEGSVVEKNLIIKNAGTDSLFILDVTTSCGCTVAKLSRTLLLSGDTALLHINIDFSNLSGHVKKKVFLSSNDPEEKKTAIEFSALILRPIMVHPSYINFATVKIGTIQLRSIDIENTTSTPISIMKVSTIDSQCTAKPFVNVLMPFSSAKFELELRPARTGKLVGQVRIETGNLRQKFLNISYIAISK